MNALAVLNGSPRWLRRAVHSVTQGRGPLGALYDRVANRVGDAAIPAVPDVPARPMRLVIGPANEAEQGYQWARAWERGTPGLSATAMMGFDPGGYGVRADLVVPTPVYLRSPQWHRVFERYLLEGTHVVLESGLPLLGRRYGSDAFAEAARFRDAGLQVAVMFHGSDLRLPSRHARENAWSPFSDPAVPSALLEDRATRNIAGVTALGLTAFVSTPDLLQYLPAATWCPVVIDPAQWAGPREPWRTRRPVVLHAPSSSRMKGSERVEPVLRRLDAEGVIEYRRVGGLRHDQMRQQYAEAEIVLDQFLIGSYGVAACEAMAAGCLVVGHVDEPTRRVVEAATGLDVPIVDATVDTVERVLRGIVADPGAFDEVRGRGVPFVTAVHDGRRSAAALAGFAAAR